MPTDFTGYTDDKRQTMLIDKTFLDELTAEAKISERLRTARDMRTTSADRSQRMFNALEPGTAVPIHRHRFSTETVIVVRGSLREDFYNDKGDIIESFLLKAGECPALQIPKGQWHSVEVLESGTVIFEAKDGPYTPATEEDILSL